MDQHRILVCIEVARPKSGDLAQKPYPLCVVRVNGSRQSVRESVLGFSPGTGEGGALWGVGLHRGEGICCYWLLLLAADCCWWLVVVAGMVHVPFTGDTYYLDPCR